MMAQFQPETNLLHRPVLFYASGCFQSFSSHECIGGRGSPIHLRLCQGFPTFIGHRTSHLSTTVTFVWVSAVKQVGVGNISRQCRCPRYCSGVWGCRSPCLSHTIIIKSAKMIAGTMVNCILTMHDKENVLSIN